MKNKHDRFNNTKQTKSYEIISFGTETIDICDHNYYIEYQYFL